MSGKIVYPKVDYFTAALNKYNKNRQIDIDKIIGKLAANHIDSLNIAKILNNRLEHLIIAKAHLNIANSISNKTKTEVKKVLQTSINKKILNYEKRVELEINRLLVFIIGSKNDSSNKVEKGNVDENGYPGFNPQAIKNVFKNGNLRERMYLVYRDGESLFTKDIFVCEKEIDLINLILKLLKVNFTIDKDLIKDICNNKFEPEAFGPYERGIYGKITREDKLRVSRKKEEMDILAKRTQLKIKQDSKRYISLSLREKLAKTGDIPKIYKPSKKKYNGNGDISTTLYEYKSNLIDPSIPGSLRYKMAPNQNDHPYVKCTISHKEQQLAGPSGVLDYFMTFAICLGITNKVDLLSIRLACIGFMTEGLGDHSVHEIMWSSKSFGLKYTPGVRRYLDIYDKNFLKDLYLIIKAEEDKKVIKEVFEATVQNCNLKML